MVKAESSASHLPPLRGFGENALISWDLRPRLSPIAATRLKNVGKDKDLRPRLISNTASRLKTVKKLLLNLVP